MLYCLLPFSKLSFSKKNILRTLYRVSNGLDPGQEKHSVSPDLGPKCLQRLSAELSRLQKSPLDRKKLISNPSV